MELATNLCITLDQNVLQVFKVDNERYIGYIYNFNRKVHEKELLQFFLENNLKYKEIIFNNKINNDKYKAVVEFYCSVYNFLNLGRFRKSYYSQ